jgi:hypothetical protein
MVSNVTNLLKTIKNVEDKGQHGSFALDAAIHAIDFAIKVSFCVVFFWGLPNFLNFI